MKITKKILTNNPCDKAGKTIKVKGLMLHSIGCPQPSAEKLIKSWNTSSANVCVHGFIDGNTGEVYQTLPWDRRGWHCGSTANGTHIGIEMCEPDCIKYTSGANFTCSDTAKAKAVVERTYKSAVELFAHLCAEFALNPIAEGVILSHSEGYKKGVASNHADPEHLWKGLKLPYTMDGFRKDVKAAMNPAIYRVQVGAFSNEQNAKNLLAELKKAGFEGYIKRG
jgi:N-acetyl-anhydromuramyl-L-alanine amidase AmpD